MATGDSDVDFSIYAKATGAVRLAGTLKKSIVPFHLQSDQEAIIYKWLAKTDYVDVTANPPRSTGRPVLPAFDKSSIKPDGTDAATIVLPVDMTVSVDGIEQAAKAGPWAFKTNAAGTYSIAISQFPYQDFAATISAA